MYKVVIIDDEPIILEGISKAVPWEAHGCQVVGTAENGAEGLETIRSCKPDMVLTDISMPGMDGLTMIAGLRTEFPDTMISILTGYRDFDYAQSAIRLGVCRFLLKPSNMNEIEEAIDSMAETLKKRRGEEQKSQEESLYPAQDQKAGSFLVKNALHYMEEHYKEKITLCDVADKVYVSQWHLSKLLNRYTGKSFSELLNNIRIGHAKHLLTDPSLRIGDISEMVGFLDVGHFSRVFKKQNGMSANEYRNSIG